MVRRTLSVIVVLCASGCVLLTDLDGLSSGDGDAIRVDGGTSIPDSAPIDRDAGDDVTSTGIDASGGTPPDAGPPDAAPDARAPRCKGTRGPTPVDVGGYCIDATEVRMADYDEFLAAKGDNMTGQPPECSWNTSYQPTFRGSPNQPVGALDWCDALMYCTWAGKRLCGRIGGGPTPTALVSNAAADEWFRACSKGGENDYPYGDTYENARCNSGGVNNDRVAVKSFARCEGGYPGLFDMTGNYWEWTNTCATGNASAQCIIRGSSYIDGHPETCAGTYSIRRDSGGTVDVAIRCCSDLE